MLFSFISILLFCTSSFAIDTGKIKGYFGGSSYSNPSVGNMKDTILSYLAAFGYISAFIMILTTGILYITGNPAQKARLKEKLWLILAGIALLGGGLPLLQEVANLFNTFGQQM